MTPFNQITQQFTSVLDSWQIIGLDIAKDLFVVLATIQLIWSAALWMFNKDEPDSVLVNLIRRMILLSIFWEILLNYNTWIPPIVNTFRAVGSKMSGTHTIYPGDVFERGIDLASAIYQGTKGDGIWNHISGGITSAFTAIVIFLIFTRIAIEMILIFIGSRIILVGGIIMLGFAGSQWTQKYAERYFATSLNIGIKMLFITLIVGLGESLSDTWGDMIESAPPDSLLETYLSIVGASLVYGYLAVRIPDMAVSMLTGELAIGFPDASGRMVAAAMAPERRWRETGGQEEERRWNRQDEQSKEPQSPPNNPSSGLHEYLRRNQSPL